MRTTRNSESGMAMVLVITVLAALLAIGAIGLSLQLNSTKSAGLAKDSRSALYCAEAGIAAGRNLLAANRAVWDDILDTDPLNNPDWYDPVTGILGDIDNDGVNDYSVTIKDDGDDTNLAADSNDTIVVMSVCTKYSNTPISVTEVISMRGGGHSYRAQSGQGSGNTGNAN